MKRLITTMLIAITIFTLCSGIGAAAEHIIKPPDSIQDAVNNAASGDVITVKPGTYSGSITIDKENLTIRSESGNPEDTVIKANSNGQYLFWVKANNTTISGFKVTADGRSDVTGIRLSKCSNCTITDNKAESNTDAGINLVSSELNTIFNNTADLNYHGIVLEGECSNNNMISNHVNSNTKYGFYLMNSSSNSFYYNTAQYNNFGFYLMNSNLNIISGNDVSNNTGYGMWISHSNNSTISGNTANETNHGISLDSADGNTVSGNVVSLNSISGLYMCRGSDNNTVFNNYLNNTRNADISNYNNTWNTTKTAGKNIIGGPYIAGNFWAKPDGTGFSENATDTDLDGIADSQYAGTNFTDYLPLVLTSTTETPILPVANFSSNTTEGYAPLDVQFTDNSENATSVSWDFENDGAIDSTDRTPLHTYSSVGTHTVNLTAINGNGTNSSLGTITVLIKPAPVLPVANFSSNVSSGSAPLSVQFNDSSENATGWNWDFGDGNNSTAKNPINTYSKLGNYTVNLTVSNANGTNSISGTINVLEPEPIPVLPVANFSSNVTSGFAPLSVQFNDSSLNATSLYWDFGDSTNSTESNPLHIYSSAGTYPVNLTAINGNGTNSSFGTITVSAKPEPVLPVANFSSNVTEGSAPLDVQFTDLSQNATKWSWDFGDGASSTDQNATHIYSTAGSYDVNLTVSNDNGTDSKLATITVYEKVYPIANFSSNVSSGYAPLSVQFNDSSENADEWYWDFNDGSNSIEQNPVHVFSSAGTYTVNLTVRNDDGNDSTESIITVTDAPVLPVASFSSNVSSGYAPLDVQFNDTSTNSPTSWEWQFGDGTENSTEQNPIHRFTSAGTYIVNLTATNVAGSSVSESATITVSAAPVEPKVLPVAYFKANKTEGFAPLTVEFTNISENATSLYWDFGDGNNSTEANPVHVFASADTYTVNLTAINGNGTNSKLANITVRTAPFLNPANRHYYALIPTPETIAWDEANDAAQSLFYLGMKGHLATVTSQNENDFIVNYLGEYNPWIGGFQLHNSSEPAGGWQWVTGEQWNYTNWGTNEPNNVDADGEDSLQFNEHKWNDKNHNNSINGYIVEFDILPDANFTAEPTSGYAPLSVKFNDSSENADEWYWDFGDGSNSTEENPVHVFSVVGTYPVNLTAINGNGTNFTVATINVLEAPEPILPVANFSSNVSSGYAPLDVQFNDSSLNATGWIWDFGDGYNSTVQNPINTYSKAGNYTVNLTVSNANGTNSTFGTINVSEPEPIPVLPVANFTSNVTSGFAPLSVQFNDSSLNATSLYWDFGDGYNSTEQNPLHTYSSAGNFDVNLTASNGNGTSFKLSTITVSTKPDPVLPVANFSSNVSSGYAPLSVQFTDSSENAIIWNWDFNDGSSSTDQNPTHTYSKPGTYTVNLTVINGNGTDSKLATIYVLVKPASVLPVADFSSNTTEGYAPLSVQFNDSSKNATSVSWDFENDGKIDSTDRTPLHTYSAVGNYTVNLTAINVNGTSFKLSTITVLATPEPVLPIANFSSNVSGGYAPLDVQFNDSSLNATSLYWDFGDGSNSTEPNPLHTYSSAGDYTVNLTAINVNGTNSSFGTITVSGKPESVLPIANFRTSVTGGYAPLSVTFTDLSENATSISWDVNGDGIEDSKASSFTYQYASAGTYTAKLTAKNENGTNEKIATIIVDRKSNGGSSGGSGGGGGGGSPEPAKNVEVKELSQVFITNGNHVKFNFPKNATAVVYLSFDARKTAGKTTSIVEMLKNQSTLTQDTPQGEVYSYLNIWVGNGGYATEKNIENATVCFRVKKSWIENKDIDWSSIILNRYSDRKWNELSTTLLREDDRYLYFVSETPGFSPFAITAKKTVIETLPETESYEQTGDEQSGDIELSIENNVEQEENTGVFQKENLSNLGSGIMYFIIGMLGVFLLGGFLYRRK